jgi:hypothetical protein
MKTGDTIRRTDIMGTVVERIIKSDSELYLYNSQLDLGYEFEVLVDDVYVPVPKTLRIHKAPPESCESCSA